MLAESANLSGFLMPAYDTLQVTKSGRVLNVMLARPKVLNAMNLQMHEELCSVWDEFQSDDELWVAVLSGSGDRAFCAGQDLKELAILSQQPNWVPFSYGSRGRSGWPRLTERFDLAKPIIAKVAGMAIGGGFELALACDIIIASQESVFALPEAKIGLVPGAGGVFRLLEQMPRRIAMGHLLTGRPFDATRAYELGLINQVAAPGELDRIVEQWVAEIADCAPLSVRSIKEAAAATSSMIEDGFKRRFYWEERRLQSADALEGARAFVEKRKPVWTGR